jgi:hypothetical protein
MSSERDERKHYSILNDGPGRYVLCDDRSDEPAPVYETEAEAYAALNRILGFREVL